jgi:hypothetical protein
MGVTVDVVVGNNWGNSDTSAYDNFTYVASPTIISINETSGSTAGGDPFIISGTNFQGATAVYFGNTPSPNFAVHNNGTAIFTQVPPGTAGTVNVTVVTPLLRRQSPEQRGPVYLQVAHS